MARCRDGRLVAKLEYMVALKGCVMSVEMFCYLIACAFNRTVSYFDGHHQLFITYNA